MTRTRQAILLLRTLLVGACGAVIFNAFGMPAGFMSGALVAVAAASLLGLEVFMPMAVRNASFYVAGMFFGSTVDEETVQSLTQWPVSIAALALSVIGILVVIPLYLRRMHGFDRETATLSAVPGALSFVLALALERGADVRRITIVQTSRLALLIIFVPLSFGLFSEIKPLAMVTENAMTGGQLAALFALGALSIPLALLLKIPAPFFSGPFFMAGGLFGSGLFAGNMPAEVLWPALTVLGTAIGARFAGVTFSMLKDGALAGAGSTVLGLAIAGAIAVPVASLLSLPLLQVWLAFAPGGIDALTVVAFSLGVDPAFVAGHQMLRFVGISLCLPFATKWLGFGESEV
ncbi:MAG: AbrB family transcriptional regulator [Pseudomonadota bacterium]